MAIGKLAPPARGKMKSPLGSMLASPRKRKKLESPIGDFKIGRRTRSKKFKEVLG